MRVIREVSIVKRVVEVVLLEFRLEEQEIWW